MEGDEHLVELCRRQLPYVTEAFETLVRRYEPLVFRTCRQYLGNREEAEEASQEIFLRVFRALPRFERRASFRTWLFRVVHNLCTTQRARIAERTRREAAYAREIQGEERASFSAGRGTGTVGRRISQALEQVSEDDRQILILRYVSELSLEEMAETLAITLSAAKMRLYRAVERFRQVYQSRIEGRRGL
jgi:RNA polymerase sigma-70 factor, ECF subfamily